MAQTSASRAASSQMVLILSRVVLHRWHKAQPGCVIRHLSSPPAGWSWPCGRFAWHRADWVWRRARVRYRLSSSSAACGWRRWFAATAANPRTKLPAAAGSREHTHQRAGCCPPPAPRYTHRTCRRNWRRSPSRLPSAAPASARTAASPPAPFSKTPCRQSPSHRPAGGWRAAPRRHSARCRISR